MPVCAERVEEENMASATNAGNSETSLTASAASQHKWASWLETDKQQAKGAFT